MAQLSDDGTVVDGSPQEARGTMLNVEIPSDQPFTHPESSPSQAREHAMRLEDDLAVLEAERSVSNSHRGEDQTEKLSMRRSRSRRSEPLDEFDVATNPLHETAAVYRPPDDPSNKLALFFKKVHDSSFIVRYVTYIVPVVMILLVPLLLGALVFKNANVGGVELLWFSIWLEIVWLTLWAGRIVAKCIPVPVGLISTVFTNNSKKWRDMSKEVELPATLFFWWLGVEVSFLPTMKNHHINGDTSTRDWEATMNKIILSIFVGTILNLIEKLIIHLIAISFHLRTYAPRIEINKFQIGSLTKLYAYSKERISMTDEEFEEKPLEGGNSGTKTPLLYADVATKAAKTAFTKVGDVAGVVAGDFTGKKINKSSHPYQVVLTLLHTTSGSQVLARRLYRTLIRDGFESVFPGDLKAAFDNNDEAEAAFTMFDKDMNGDISMEELEAVCVEIGRERKSITASLKDIDTVLSKLGNVLSFIVIVITLLVFLSLISSSAAGILTSAGSAILALSWLFSATAQEFLQSVIFVFVKHPFDVGDRVTIYGNTGALLHGDDYFVKEISLLYTEFKKMEGHVVQAPNSYLNTLFILNQRRSGGLAEAIPITLRFGTTIEQIDALRQRLLEFVRSEKREYQANILTELRAVTENYSITLNVVFFYKSNWQNELLRLQRRNKFICMLMISLQEIGIEGPRKNAQGAHIDYPLHITHHGTPPSYATTMGESHSTITSIGEERSSSPSENSTASTAIRPQHSILRKGATTAAARARGESTSRPDRHVDFSLGMSSISSGDVMGDVYNDRRPLRVDEIVRTVNRETAERRIREQDESRAAASQGSPGPLSDPQNRREGRLSQDSRRSEGRPSYSASVNRGRLLSRFGHTHERHEQDHLMEQGQYELETHPGSVGRSLSRPSSSHNHGNS